MTPPAAASPLAYGSLRSSGGTQRHERNPDGHHNTVSANESLAAVT
jgi:hypothetical protein